VSFFADFEKKLTKNGNWDVFFDSNCQPTAKGVLFEILSICHYEKFNSTVFF